MDDLISVVIPVYNVSEFVGPCLDSVLEQTYTNLDIIVVNDGSTDSSGIICDTYAAKDNRIRVIHQQNGGLSAARNAGIEIAKGKYITFIDSDDLIRPNMVDYLHNLLLSENADFSTCDSYRIDEKGQALKGKSTVVAKTIVGNENCMLAYNSWKSGMTMTAWGKLYKIELFKDIRYAIGRLHEDSFTTYKIVALCNCIAMGNQQLYAYRHRSTSIMNIRFNPKVFDSVDAQIEQYEFVRLNYPKCILLASATIIHACSYCVQKIAESDQKPKEWHPYVKRLQPIYRKHIWDFIRGQNRLCAKLFALMATIDLPISIKLLRLIK